MLNAPSTTHVVGLAEETIHPSEAALIEANIKMVMERMRADYPPGTPTVPRDAHPKTHGLVTAEFIVLDDFSHALRHGVFKTPRKFDALIRFSGGGIRIFPDTRPPQSAGMAIKLLGVEGEKLLPTERHALTQDFIMINFPSFAAPDMESYLARQETDGQPEKLRQYFETRPREEALNKLQNLHPLHNPLQARYFSQVPYMLGPNAIKFSAKPISNAANCPAATEGPDFLRDAMRKQIAECDVYFDFMVQVQTDPVRMPIEDPLTIWDEALSPFQRVAIIRIPRQDITAKGLEIAENLAFTPWHALPAHRPIGNMNRIRRVVYQTISEHRRTANGVAREEPTKLPV